MASKVNPISLELTIHLEHVSHSVPTPANSGGEQTLQARGVKRLPHTPQGVWVRGFPPLVSPSERRFLESGVRGQGRI